MFTDKIAGRDSIPDLESAANELVSLAEEINREIFDQSQQEKIRMGTTASAVLILDADFVFIHIGDSRIYQVGETVRQLTEDHSLTGRDVRNGVITAEQARTDKRRFSFAWRAL